MNVKGRIQERYYAKGAWIADSALHLGGESSPENDSVDLTLHRDKEGGFLIPGASLAGAARSYLLEGSLTRAAFLDDEITLPLVEALFGGDYASLLTIPDAKLTEFEKVLVRDGVAIDSSNGLAKDEAKYNFEILPAGSGFEIEIQLALSKEEEWPVPQADLLAGFRAILEGFQSGEIRLGAKTRRGLGGGKVAKWTIHRLDMQPNQRTHIAAWLRRTPEMGTEVPLEDLPMPAAWTPRARRGLHVKLKCRLAGSILLRTAGPKANGPDMVHLTEGDVCRIPGTAIAGALRGRAWRVVKTLQPGFQGHREDPVSRLFGPSIPRGQQGHRASDLYASDVVLPGGLDHLHVQGRVAIDRFTGGALEAHLFDQAAYWPSKQDAPFDVEFWLADPNDAEAALLLHVVRDLCLEDLPLGGESGTGRGFLRAEGGHVDWDGKRLLTIGVNGPAKPSEEGLKTLLRFQTALTDELQPEAQRA